MADEIIIAACGTSQVPAFTGDGTFTTRYNQATTASFEGLLTATRILTATEPDDFGVTTDHACRTILMLATYKIAAGGAWTWRSDLQAPSSTEPLYDRGAPRGPC